MTMISKNYDNEEYRIREIVNLMSNNMKVNENNNNDNNHTHIWRNNPKIYVKDNIMHSNLSNTRNYQITQNTVIYWYRTLDNEFINKLLDGFIRWHPTIPSVDNPFKILTKRRKITINIILKFPRKKKIIEKIHNLEKYFKN